MFLDGVEKSLCRQHKFNKFIDNPKPTTSVPIKAFSLRSVWRSRRSYFLRLLLPIIVAKPNDMARIAQTIVLNNNFPHTINKERKNLLVLDR